MKIKLQANDLTILKKEISAHLGKKISFKTYGKNKWLILDEYSNTIPHAIVFLHAGKYKFEHTLKKNPKNNVYTNVELVKMCFTDLDDNKDMFRLVSIALKKNQYIFYKILKGTTKLINKNDYDSLSGHFRNIAPSKEFTTNKFDIIVFDPETFTSEIKKLAVAYAKDHNEEVNIAFDDIK